MHRLSKSVAQWLLDRSLSPAMTAVLCFSALVSPASAETVEEFYRGKQIRIYIRAAPGGNYDVYSRVLARHMTRHIPGNPTIIPVNMPGGGGLVALNFVAFAAPKDGTVLTMITQSFPMEQALGTETNLKVDMRSLNWIGNMSNTNEFMFTAKSSLTRTLDDARQRETVVAATGIGSVVTQLAAVYNNVLGTKLKVIYGYPSGPEMTLALDRGEVEGRSTSNPQVMAPTTADVLAKYNFLIQAGPRKIPGYESVPLLLELARNDDDRRIFEFMSSGVALARPVVTNTGVPPERVAALRRAFDATLADPVFLHDAEKQSLEIGAKSGEELGKMVAAMLDSPPAVLDRVRQAIKLRPSDAARAKGASGKSE